MNVYLSGMIGSGKTTIGLKLAKELDRPFFDLDREMDKILGYSFHRLVSEKGWLAFRELEYSICKRFAHYDNSIIGLGGGTIRYEWNRDVLKGTGTIILLYTPIATLVERVALSDRPRVNPSTTVSEDIILMWKEHKDTYFNSADIIYETENKSLEREVNELKEIINGNN